MAYNEWGLFPENENNLHPLISQITRINSGQSSKTNKETKPNQTQMKQTKTLIKGTGE